MVHGSSDHLGQRLDARYELFILKEVHEDVRIEDDAQSKVLPRQILEHEVAIAHSSGGAGLLEVVVGIGAGNHRVKVAVPELAIKVAIY